MNIKVKCPDCGKILILADSPDIDTKTFTCPVCKEKHVVGHCKRIVEQPRPKPAVSEETQYASSTARMNRGEETQYAGSEQATNGEETRIFTAQQPKIGALIDNFGRAYQLKTGINTIGRKANSSTASVQIDTPDRTMSRSHAVVEVHNAAGKIVHILKNGANKNPSFLNGNVLGSNDQLVLTNGAKIKFGNTELTFKL